VIEPLVGICEDDDDLRQVLARAFESEQFAVAAVASGRQAVEAFSARRPDVLVMDIGLPDSDGRDVCQALRAHGVGAPVIFLTARGALTDRLSGFSAGGDDYVTKPFELAELIARVRALVRRAGDPAPPPPGGIELDPAAHGIAIDGRSEPLTPTEFRLLALLVARRGEVVRRRELREAGWPDGAVVHDNTLDSYVGRLRRKMAGLGAPEAIETARGVGYLLR
jgi:two-component system response regulator MprA